MFAAILAGAMLAFSQSEGARDDQAEVEAFLESYGRALSDCNADLLRGLLADDFDEMGTGRGPSEVVDELRTDCEAGSIMTIDFTLVEYLVTDAAVSVTALARASFDDEPLELCANFELAPYESGGDLLLRSRSASLGRCDTSFSRQ